MLSESKDLADPSLELAVQQTFHSRFTVSCDWRGNQRKIGSIFPNRAILDPSPPPNLF